METLKPLELINGTATLALGGLKYAMEQLKGGRWAELAEIAKAETGDVK